MKNNTVLLQKIQKYYPNLYYRLEHAVPNIITNPDGKISEEDYRSYLCCTAFYCGQIEDPFLAQEFAKLALN